VSIILARWISISRWYWFRFWAVVFYTFLILVVYILFLVLLLLIPGGSAIEIAGIPLWLIIGIIILLPLTLMVVIGSVLTAAYFLDLLFNFLNNWRTAGFRTACRRLLAEAKANAGYIISGGRQGIDDFIQKVPGASWFISKLNQGANMIQTTAKKLKKLFGF
jgi:hypothetical protein